MNADEIMLKEFENDVCVAELGFDCIHCKIKKVVSLAYVQGKKEAIEELKNESTSYNTVYAEGYGTGQLKGYEKGKKDAAEEIFKQLDEFPCHSDIDGVTLCLKEITEYQEIKVRNL